MEFTLDQALIMGVEAQKKGKLQEANRYYTTILKVQPKHPDANHNMGILAVSVGKIQEALTFFKIALENNSRNAQFWLSYIDALIKLNRVTDAKAVFDEAKSKGVKGDGFNQIEKRIDSSTSKNAGSYKRSVRSLNKNINTFYTNLHMQILNSASAGWRYNIQFDQDFLAKGDVEVNYEQKNKSGKDPQPFKIERQNIKQYYDFTLGTLISKLNEIEGIKEKFHTLESLNCSENKILFADSFSKNNIIDLRGVQTTLFKKDRLNVVIIGAGPCGLYLSNALKYQLRHKINILVLDNHCNERHFKKPFSRRWLSDLPMKYFDKYFDSNIRKLANSFGKDGCIGLPINFIEVLLLISAKELGVNFYFDQNLEYSVLNNSLVDLVFDASGGRMPSTKQGEPMEQEIIIQIPNISTNYDYAGIKNLPIKNINSKKNILITLKEDGYYHYPHFNDTSLFLRMMKLTQVPISLHPTLMKFVQNLNNNRFYIWRGKLVEEINEILVLINLTIDEYGFLKRMVRNMQKLNMDLVEKAIEKNSIGTDLLDLLKICAANKDEQIYINSPFVSKPSINLKPLDQRINGVEVYPIGDSLFQGNPKVGNGLGTHLVNIIKLVEVITSHQK